MTDSEKLDFLGGQVHALMGFALAAIKAHHDLAKFAWHFDSVGKTTLKRVEATLTSESYVDGVKDVQDRLGRGIGISLGRQEDLNKDI